MSGGRWKNLVGRWGSGSGETDDVRIDGATNSLNTVDYSHHEIHSGNHYFIAGFQEVGEDVSIDFGITTPDTDVTAHVTTLINGTSEIEIYIYEDSVFTVGTPVIPVNNNRNSLNTSDMAIVIGPTISDLGTELSAQSSGKAGTTPQKAVGGLNTRENEINLKRNTKYIFQTISRDSANILSFRADWYEHIAKH
jgi:hypothetical protein